MATYGNNKIPNNNNGWNISWGKCRHVRCSGVCPGFSVIHTNHFMWLQSVSPFDLWPVGRLRVTVNGDEGASSLQSAQITLQTQDRRYAGGKSVWTVLSEWRVRTQQTFCPSENHRKTTRCPGDPAGQTLCKNISRQEETGQRVERDKCGDIFSLSTKV